MTQQKSILIIFVIAVIVFVSAEVHKGYSHTKVHNKHGGKFAYKIHHVYHLKKHGHGGGGGGHGAKHGTLYHKQKHDNLFDDSDDFEGTNGYIVENYKGKGSGFNYGSGYPYLSGYSSGNSYSGSKLGSTFGSPYKSNLFEDDSFSKGYRYGSSKSYSYSYPQSSLSDFQTDNY